MTVNNNELSRLLNVIKQRASIDSAYRTGIEFALAINAKDEADRTKYEQQFVDNFEEYRHRFVNRGPTSTTSNETLADLMISSIEAVQNGAYPPLWPGQEYRQEERKREKEQVELIEEKRRKDEEKANEYKEYAALSFSKWMSDAKLMAAAEARKAATLSTTQCISGKSRAKVPRPSPIRMGLPHAKPPIKRKLTIDD